MSVAHRCSACEKAYSRATHLRRHELTHTNHKSFSCPFCSQCFVKRDVARRHAILCAQKANSAPPPPLKRGKQTRACDRCSQSKVSCDAGRPCGRCRRRAVPCTYARAGFQGGEAEARRSCTPFLSSYTGARGDTSATVLVADGPSPTDAECPATCTERDSSPCGAEPWSLVDSGAAWSALLDEFFPETDGASNRWPLLSSQETSTLGSRINDIIYQLSVTHKHMAQAESHPSFNWALAESVITAENLKRCTQAYFLRFHHHLPIVHKPSFVLKTTSPSLLLAVFAAGSVCSVPEDQAFSVRCFFDAIEEHVFSHGPFQQHRRHSETSGPSADDIQALQAALIMNCLQGNMNNEETRRRLRVRRHPSLVWAIRSLGLTRATRRNPSSSWEAFIADEICVRISSWTFLVDGCLSLFFNNPPSMVVSEMIGDLPSHEGVFEAASAAEFERLASSEKLQLQSKSLNELAFTILNGTWPPPQHSSFAHATVAHLLIIISALQSITFAVRANFLGPESLRAVFRATDRWQELWKSVSLRDGEKQVGYQGLLKSGAEICWVLRTIIELTQAGEKGCHYMQAIATDSLADLEEFLYKYQ